MKTRTKNNGNSLLSISASQTAVTCKQFFLTRFSWNYFLDIYLTCQFPVVTLSNRFLFLVHFHNFLLWFGVGYYAGYWLMATEMHSSATISPSTTTTLSLHNQSITS